MIRGRALGGRIVLGITARELDGLIAGAPVHFPVRAECGGGPPAVLWFGETDQDLIERLGQMYPEGAPATVHDGRAEPRPELDDPSRLTWAYYDYLCDMAERFGTRERPRTAAHLERLRGQIVALRGERTVEQQIDEIALVMMGTKEG